MKSHSMLRLVWCFPLLAATACSDSNGTGGMGGVAGTGGIGGAAGSGGMGGVAGTGGMGGVAGTGGMGASAGTAEGRFVAFDSIASDLVDDDTNGTGDVFVHDRTTGMTTRVSVDSAGGQGNDGSGSPAITADGRFVAFESEASDLVDDDTNDATDVFVHDRTTGMTTRVSVDSAGGQGNDGSGSPAITADGRFVAFESEASDLVDDDTNDATDVFVHDRTTGMTTRVSLCGRTQVICLAAAPNGPSFSPAITADGRFVAFNSIASDLVDDDTNGKRDGFVHDRTTGMTTRVSVDSAGGQGNDSSGSPAITADGRFVAFNSNSSDLVDDDTNDATDVFVHDRTTGITTRVSVCGQTVCLLGSGGNGSSIFPAITADGRFVAFNSIASDLVDDDTNGKRDGFVHDRTTGMTTRVSVDSAGGQGNGFSGSPAITADGRFVAFESRASDLVDDDTNGQFDVFVHDRTTGMTTRVSVDSAGGQGNGPSGSPAISQ